MNPISKFAWMGVAILAGACFAARTDAMRVPRAELQPSQNISAKPETSTEIDVPARAVASRNTRPITVQEVFAAIRSAMGHSGISGAASLRPEDILLQTQILVDPGDAGLQVLRSDFDAELKRGRFLLWASHDPKVLPFFVAVRFTENIPLAGLQAMSEHIHAAAKQDLPAVAARAVKAEILVSPGEQATLLLRSNSFRMMADVVALERGAMGQRIHVRVVDTGKIFSAQVDGRAHLETVF